MADGVFTNTNTTVGIATLSRTGETVGYQPVMFAGRILYGVNATFDPVRVQETYATQPVPEGQPGSGGGGGSTSTDPQYWTDS